MDKDTHTEHCCRRHGCKYGENADCPVVTGKKSQSYSCEQCHEENDGTERVVIVQCMYQGEWRTAVHRYEMRHGIYRNDPLEFTGLIREENATEAACLYAEEHPHEAVRVIEVATTVLEMTRSPEDIPERYCLNCSNSLTPIQESFCSRLCASNWAAWQRANKTEN